MIGSRIPLALTILGAAVIALGGCGGTSEPTRFYVLSTPPNLAAEKPSPDRVRKVSLGVGPVSLPLHLNRPQIVTHDTRHKLDLAEFDRWAEPLKDNFTRVLAENLSILMSTDQVAVFPWKRSIPIDYQVTVEVNSFIVVGDGNSVLAARWMIFGKAGRTLLFTRKTEYRANNDGENFEALVEGLSRTLADLSREIATALLALSS